MKKTILTHIAAHPGDVDNFNNAFRVNNAIKYTSANYEGLTFGAAKDGPT
ncbi:hypothetical protein PQR75_42595 [Paraburkholderia fungorum]